MTELDFFKNIFGQKNGENRPSPAQGSLNVYENLVNFFLNLVYNGSLH